MVEFALFELIEAEENWRRPTALYSEGAAAAATAGQYDRTVQ